MDLNEIRSLEWDALDYLEQGEETITRMQQERALDDMDDIIFVSARLHMRLKEAQLTALEYMRLHADRGRVPLCVAKTALQRQIQHMYELKLDFECNDVVVAADHDENVSVVRVPLFGAYSRMRSCLWRRGMFYRVLYRSIKVGNVYADGMRQRIHELISRCECLFSRCNANVARVSYSFILDGILDELAQ